MLYAIWYHLYNFTNVKNNHGGVLKVTFLHGCFSRSINCTNDTKSRKVSHLNATGLFKFLKVPKLTNTENEN